MAHERHQRDARGGGQHDAGREERHQPIGRRDGAGNGSRSPATCATPRPRRPDRAALSLSGNLSWLIAGPPPPTRVGTDVRPHDGVGGRDPALGGRQRAAARRRDLGQLQPFDHPEHPRDPHVRAHPAHRPIDQRQLGALIGIGAGRCQRRQRRVVRAAIQAQHAHQPPAAHAPANQADRDLGEPAAQRRRLAQRRQLLERRHERVLHDLFAFVAVAEQARRDRQQIGGVAAVQHLAPPAIAFDGARHQLGVAGGIR